MSNDNIVKIPQPTIHPDLEIDLGEKNTVLIWAIDKLHPNDTQVVHIFRQQLGEVIKVLRNELRKQDGDGIRF